MGIRPTLILALALSVATAAGAQTVSQTRAQVPPGTTMLNSVSSNSNGTVLQVGGYASAMFSITASVAMSGGGAFFTAYLLKAGISLPTVLAAVKVTTSTLPASASRSAATAVSSGSSFSFLPPHGG